MSYVDLRSYFKDCVELWSRERGLNRISTAHPPSFYMHLKDPHAYWEMIQVRLIRGRQAYASRKMAERIEIQTRYAAYLHNVNVRRISGIWLKRNCSLAEIRIESRFSPDFEIPLGIL